METAFLTMSRPAVILGMTVGDLTIDATLKEGAMNTSPRCDACGMPMTQPSQHAKGDPENPYCIYCTNAAGDLKPRDEIREGMIQYVMKLENWPRDQAAADVDRKMAELPAWAGAV
jgi:hypothetical protein